MEPRPYQRAALLAASQALNAGATSVVIVSPTGSGKSLMGALASRGHLARNDTNRVVWLAHRRELLDQAAVTLRNVGLEVNGWGTRSARVTVESVQTILSRGTAPEGTLLVADEAHHFADSNRCGDICKLYPRIVGLTATPERGDGKPLKPPFSALVVAAQIRELVALGHLVPLRIRCPAHHLAKGKIAQEPVDAYLQEARGTRAICFAPHLKAAEKYLADFRAQGVRGAVVSGKTPTELRADILRMHRRGELDVIVNVGVLTEGYDDPTVSAVIVARGCESQGLWLQMTGRALRPAPGKTHAILLDLRGVTHKLGRPDADRTFSLDGDAIQVVDSARPTLERLCKTCHAPLDDSGKCVECGVDNGQVVPEATGAALVSWHDCYEEVKETMKPRRDALSLAGMLRKMPSRAAFVRYAAIFKRPPDPQCIRQAQEVNRLANVEFARSQVDRERTSAP